MKATGIGSLPGEDIAEAIKLVFGELEGQIPFLPELPSRGVWSSMIGRTLGLVEGLDADLVPEGWRLTGTSGAPSVDQRRARSRLNEDLDRLEELGQDYTGQFKIQVTGPWTLAATVERPKGDKVLGDYGARRDLAHALAEGVAEHAREVRKRVSGASLIVQIDEPALAVVANAGVPTASGWGTHRHVDRPELGNTLALIVEAVADAGAESWVHACAAQTPWDLVLAAGVQGIAVDLTMLSTGDYDMVSGAIESGCTVATQFTERVLDEIGIEPDARTVVTQSCGMANATPAEAREALRRASAIARSFD